MEFDLKIEMLNPSFNQIFLQYKYVQCKGVRSKQALPTYRSRARSHSERSMLDFHKTKNVDDTLNRRGKRETKKIKIPKFKMEMY